MTNPSPGTSNLAYRGQVPSTSQAGFWGWDFGQVLTWYLDGSGYGLYIDTPFVAVTAR